MTVTGSLDNNALNYELIKQLYYKEDKCTLDSDGGAPEHVGHSFPGERRAGRARGRGGQAGWNRVSFILKCGWDLSPAKQHI
jgi:hypothetical protein